MRARQIKISNCILVLIIALAMAVSYGVPQTIKTEGGVRIVSNAREAKWAQDRRLYIRQSRIIGGIEVEDENFIFKSPMDMDMDDSGCLYVLDAGECRIQKFGPDGQYLSTIGRRGQGPGEFQHPLSFDLDARGRLWVGDLTQVRILAADGKELRLFRFPAPLFGRIRALASGWIATGGMFRILQPEEKKPKLIKIHDADGNVKKEFGEIRDYGKPLLNSQANWFHYDVDAEGNFLLSFWYQNRIEKYSAEGRLVWKADRVLPYDTKPLSEGMMEVSETGRSIQSPELNFVSDGIAVDEKGRAWVITRRRQLTKEETSSTIVISGGATIRKGPPPKERTDVYKLEIYDPDGILLQEIALPHDANAIRIKKQHLLLLDAEQCRVFQYEIIEKEGS